jgi:hypothetical protein
MSDWARFGEHATLGTSSHLTTAANGAREARRVLVGGSARWTARTMASPADVTSTTAFKNRNYLPVELTFRSTCATRLPAIHFRAGPLQRCVPSW